MTSPIKHLSLVLTTATVSAIVASAAYAQDKHLAASSPPPGKPTAGSSIKVSATSPLKQLMEDYLSNDYKPGQDPLATSDMKPRSEECVRLGWQYFDRKDYQTALKRFFLAIRMDRTNPRAYYGVAFVCSIQNNLSDAITFYREALKYEKNFSPIYSNLANALLLQTNGKSTEAPHLLDTAIKVDPKNINAYVTYAQYLAAKSDWNASGEMAKKAITLGATLDPAFITQLKQHGILLPAR